mmetsp:Transcript_32291/g.49440  ORF Transcript_32291/g.49440 Transcript_32291/m.49440 type:complete len:168 (+) Transcript_32291:672-1175(+)
MDGKQARRTGNSSPLGLIFDHGCDALTMGIQSMIGAKCYQMGDSIFTMLFMIGGGISFHFSTLEEYYTGGLFLGVGNAVTDGSFIIFTLYFILGAYGRDTYLQPMVSESELWEGSPEITRLAGLMFMVISIQWVTTFLCFKKIFSHASKVNSGEIEGEPIKHHELVV